MTLVNTYQAKTILSQLIARALAGEEIVIAKAGEPQVTLTPFKSKKNKKTFRKPGLWKGKVFISDDFNEESEEINKMFYGE